MGLRFQSAAEIEALPDTQIESSWEVIMPSINLLDPIGSMSGYDGSLWDKIKTFGSNWFSAYTPIVEEIVFGVTNFKTNTRRVRTGWCNVPEDIQNYHDVSITFFVSAGMLTQYYLSAWRQLVFNAEGEYYYPMSVYKKNIEVFFYGPGNIGLQSLATVHFTLQGCFPASQQPFQLMYKDDPKRLRISANFKVDKVVYDYSTTKKAVIEELVTSPTEIVDKTINSLNNLLGAGSSQYNVEGTYGFTTSNNESNPITDTLSNFSF